MNKISKQRAFNIVKNSINNDIPLVECELEQLLYYLAPAIPKNPKNRYDWVARFMNKAETDRLYLNYIHVVDDKIIATNGHILGVTNNEEDLENGLYNYMAGELVKTDSTYKLPNFTRAITTDPITLPITVSHFENDGKLYSKFNNGYTLQRNSGNLYSRINDKYVIQRKYFNLIIEGSTLVKYPTEGNKALEFQDNYGRFVIMPTSIGSEN